MKKIILYFVLGLIAFSSCKKSKKNKEGSSEIVELTLDQIKINLDTTITAMNQTWDSLIFDDDKKMTFIKRLLDEVSFTESFDEEKLKEVFLLFDTVVAARYTLEDIDDAKIDEYDAIQTKLITAANELAESTPNIESHPLAIELMNDISEVDGMTFSKRADYDVFAKQLNNVINQYPTIIQQLGTPYTNYNTVGTFEPEDGY